MRSTVLRESDLPPLPDDWRLSPIETLAETNPEVLGAATPQGFVFRYIDLGAVDQGHIDWTMVREEVLRDAPSRARRPVSTGDVLFGTVRPALQSHAAIQGDAQGPLVASTGFAVLRARPDEADGRFLFHCVLSDLFSLQARRTEVGSNYPAVNESDVRTFLVPHPGVREQRRIAAILDTLDDAIRRTEQVIAKLQHTKQGLLHDLLTRGVDENGHLRDIARTPESFAQTDLGVLPRHWEIAGFSTFRCLDRELIKTGPFGTAMRGRQWADTGVPVITIGSLGERTLIRENLLFLGPNDAKAFSSYELRAGDLVFSRVADIGRSLVIRDSEFGWIMSSNLMRISLDRSRVYSDYVHLAIVYADNSRQQIRRLANAGAREVVNTAVLTQLRFAWPPREEQIRICRVVEGHDAEVTAELQVLDKLGTLKRGLVHDLLSGRVRVPVPSEALA